MRYETNATIRTKICELCRDPSKRFIGRPEDGHPNRWYPNQVVDCETGQPFTEDSAWNFVADCIDDHHALEIVKLIKPPGSMAYELKVQMKDGNDLYIKIYLARKTVIGRSFHYSDK